MHKKSAKGSREDNHCDSARSTPTKKQKSKSQKSAKSQKINLQHLSQAFYQPKKSNSLSKIVLYD